ncbi:LPXTG cell wall anchor domain-containing protein [Streptomyces sp. NPDC060001]
MAVVGIGFEDNPAATLILGALVMVAAAALLYWRYKKEKK